MTKDRADGTKLGFVYAVILLIFSNVLAVDWRSDEIFYLLGIYPFGAAVFFWPLVGYLSVGRESRFGGVLCLGAVAAYDYGVVYKLTRQGSEALFFIERVWTGNKLGLMTLAAFFLIGQVVVVISIIHKEFGKPRAI